MAAALLVINKVIEYRFFRPICFSIIALFVIVNTVSFVHNVAKSYTDSASNSDSKAVQILFSKEKFSFNFSDDQTVSYIIKSGDTLQGILLKLGASSADIAELFSSLRKVFDPRYIVVGNKVSVTYNEFQEAINEVLEDGNKKSSTKKAVKIKEVVISVSSDEKIITMSKGDGYKTKIVKAEYSRSISRYSGTIDNSLYVDAVNAGVSARTMMNMINLYGYAIDFQRDIHKGDKFEMLVESFYSDDGKKIKDGDVLYSSLTLRNSKIETYMHKMKSGLVEYFDGSGNSVKKSLLRTPINGARISSRYGLRRHPVLGYSKMHKGTDFAAPRGTPIFAAGDGTITYYGRYSSYGNYVRIRHSNEYSTAYAHASRFNRKFRKGSRVKQGDIVAYVGTTGRSTGPHLHYEVLYRGRQINPNKVRSTSGIKLKGSELIRFKQSKEQIDYYRQNIPNLISSR